LRRCENQIKKFAQKFQEIIAQNRYSLMNLAENAQNLHYSPKKKYFPSKAIESEFL